jgi:WD40 repeat protein
MRRYEPDENAVLLWRPAGETSQGRLLDHPSGIRRLLFTRDDQFLITLGKDPVVRFWQTGDGTLERSVPVPEHEAGTVWTVSPDGHVALCLRAGLTGLVLSVFDLDSAELVGEPQVLLQRLRHRQVP